MPAIEGIADRMDVHPDGWSVVEEPLQETLKKSGEDQFGGLQDFQLSISSWEWEQWEQENKKPSTNQVQNSSSRPQIISSRSPLKNKNNSIFQNDKEMGAFLNKYLPEIAM